MDKLTYIHTTPISSKKANLIQVLNMCKSFVNFGIEVTLLLPGSKEKSNIEIDKRIEIKFYEIKDWMPSTIKFSWAIFKYLKKYKLEGLVFIRQFTIVPVVQLFKYHYIYESHNNTLFSKPIIDKVLKRILKRLITKKQFLLLFSISGELNKFWEQFLNKNQEKIDYYHDGVEKKLFQNILSKSEARSELGFTVDSQKIVTYAGSLYKDRGIENIIFLARDFPDALFMVIGGPNSEIDDLVNLSGQMKVNNIQFKGVVPHKDVPKYLYMADILLAFWSDKVKTIKYCSPLKVFEYMASERLIIAHAYPTIKEVLTDDDSILIEPNSYQSMKLGMEEALKNEKPERAVNAKRKVMKMYTWDKRAEYIIDRVRKLLDA